MVIWLVALGCSGSPSPGEQGDPGCDENARPTCDGSDLVRCVAGEEVRETCSYGCAETGCLVCAPSSRACTEEELQICDADGQAQLTNACPAGCNEDRLECNLCVPETTSCEGQELQRCGADGLVASTEVCAHGCGGVPADCLDECTEDAQCADDLPCTRDQCVPDPITGRKACENVPDDTLVPDDQIPCTTDTCVAGTAVHTLSDQACEDGASCTVDTCNPQDPTADADGCVAVFGACSDGASCTTDVCDPSAPAANGDGCVFTAGTCSDGASCTSDVCDPSDPSADVDGCVYTAGTCSDGASCTSDSCDPSDPAADVDGCVYAADDASCVDSYACTEDRCDPTDSGASQAGCVNTADDLVCEDGVDCTVESCVGSGGDSEGCDLVLDDTLCPGQDSFCFSDGCHDQPVITAVSPSDGWPGAPIEVLITGTGLEEAGVVTIAGADASCTGTTGTLLTCSVAVGGSGKGDVVVTNPGGLTDTAANAFTWIAAGADVTWCNIQFPGDVAGTNSSVATSYYSQVYLAGETDTSASQVPGVRSQFGTSVEGATGDETDPTLVNTWQWFDTSPTVGFDYGLNNDEYAYEWTPPGGGTWHYAFRVTRDDGLTWTYCFGDGLDPSGVRTIQSDF